jgi:hypothetical protein
LEIGEKSRFENRLDIWYLFNNALQSNKILWYPSAGLDLTDIISVNAQNFPEFNNISPNIFIHTDCDKTPNDLNFNDSIEISDIVDLTDYRFRLHSIKVNNTNLWLIYLNLRNEEFLKLLLNYEIETNFLYSVCDGMFLQAFTMDHPENIPLKYFSHFYNKLKIKYHLSSYHNQDDWHNRIKEGHIIAITEFLENANETPFDINQFIEVENGYANHVDVYNRFHNFGNTNELWLRIC